MCNAFRREEKSLGKVSQLSSVYPPKQIPFERRWLLEQVLAIVWRGEKRSFFSFFFLVDALKEFFLTAVHFGKRRMGWEREGDRWAIGIKNIKEETSKRFETLVQNNCDERRVKDERIVDDYNQKRKTNFSNRSFRKILLVDFCCLEKGERKWIGGVIGEKNIKEETSKLYRENIVMDRCE